MFRRYRALKVNNIVLRMGCVRRESRYVANEFVLCLEGEVGKRGPGLVDWRAGRRTARYGGVGAGWL